jgi:hypothetical protein
MPKTAIGLFKNPDAIDEVVQEIEAHGFPRKEVRTMEEPATFESTGVMSFPRLDFETDLIRELSRIGATKAESLAFLDGPRRGGALVLATALDERVKAAAEIMNQHGAVEVAETSGAEPSLPHVVREYADPGGNSQGHSVIFTW